MTAIRIAKEFNIKIVLDGVADGHMLTNEIRASGFPVIVHATMVTAGGDLRTFRWRTRRKLRAAGIPVALAERL